MPVPSLKYSDNNKSSAPSDMILSALVLLQYLSTNMCFCLGLCIGFALFIEFIRVYIITKHHIRDGERETLPLND